MLHGRADRLDSIGPKLIEYGESSSLSACFVPLRGTQRLKAKWLLLRCLGAVVKTKRSRQDLNF